MNKPLRVNLYGGPGTGKSTLAASLYAYLKQNHCKVDLVQEYIKTWAWQGKKAKDFDQFYVLAQQMKRELDLLRAGVSIITDSPLLMNLAYVFMYNRFLYWPLHDVVREFDDRWPSMQIGLRRRVPYEQAGRYEDLAKAEETDKCIEMVLEAAKVPVLWIDPVKERGMLFDLVLQKLQQKEGALCNG